MTCVCMIHSMTCVSPKMFFLQCLFTKEFANFGNESDQVFLLYWPFSQQSQTMSTYICSVEQQSHTNIKLFVPIDIHTCSRWMDNAILPSDTVTYKPASGLLSLNVIFASVQAPPVLDSGKVSLICVKVLKTFI